MPVTPNENSLDGVSLSGSGRRRHVLVTGGGRGIGRACARRFEDQGWCVSVLDLAASAEPASAYRLDVAVDVCNAGAVQSAVSQAVARFGAADACVNAAGVYPRSTLASADSELYRRIFDINVLGTVLATQATVATMPDGGAVVNFASINAFAPKTDQLLYGAAKAAVVQLTKTLAAELAPRRIRVNAVAPGPVDTEGMQGVPGRLAQIAATVPLGRVAAPQEIAALVHWLVDGEGAQYISGETLVASGALVMR